MQGTVASKRRMVTAVILGNILIWYDIAAFSFFANYIAKSFFPQQDPAVALIVTFGTFAVSFIVRPLGALVLGPLADRRGRKLSLLISTALMTGGTALLAFLPTYEMIGIAAPVGLLIARMVQGFAAGGEFGSATAMLAENDPARRGRTTSWQLASQALSGVLAAAFGVGLALSLSEEEMGAWGWRIPFIFGLLIGPVGLYIRWRIDESPLAQVPLSSPVRSVLTHHRGSLLAAIGLVALSTSVTYLLGYVPTYAVRELKLPGIYAHLGVMLAFLVQIPIVLRVGDISDRIGRTRIMATGGGLLLLSFFPVFVLQTQRPEPVVLILSLLWFAVLKAIYTGPLAAMLTELFPVETRATGVALSYNIAVPLFGGTAALTMSWINHVTGTGLGPAIYLTLTAFLSLLALLGAVALRKNAAL